MGSRTSRLGPRAERRRPRCGDRRSRLSVPLRPHGTWDPSPSQSALRRGATQLTLVRTTPHGPWDARRIAARRIHGPPGRAASDQRLIGMWARLRSSRLGAPYLIAVHPRGRDGSDPRGHSRGPWDAPHHLTHGPRQVDLHDPRPAASRSSRPTSGAASTAVHPRGRDGSDPRGHDSTSRPMGRAPTIFTTRGRRI